MDVICSKCGQVVKPEEIAILRNSVAAGGGIAGAMVGSHMGLALLGTAISFSAPLAVTLGLFGYLIAKDLRKCPVCNHIYRV